MVRADVALNVPLGPDLCAQRNKAPINGGTAWLTSLGEEHANEAYGTKEGAQTVTAIVETAAQTERPVPV